MKITCNQCKSTEEMNVTGDKYYYECPYCTAISVIDIRELRLQKKKEAEEEHKRALEAEKQRELKAKHEKELEEQRKKEAEEKKNKEIEEASKRELVTALQRVEEQRKQQEANVSGTNVSNYNYTTITSSTTSGEASNLAKLYRVRKRSLIWGVIWLIVWWPVSLYFFFRFLKTSYEIRKMR